MKNKLSAILKSVLPFLLCAVIFCTALLPLSAAENTRSLSERVRDLLRSQVVLNDFYTFVEVVDGGDPSEIIQSFLTIYPDFVAEAKRGKEGGLGDPMTAGNNKEYERAVNEMLQNQIVFDDFIKICEAADGGDGGEILQVMVEIFPDFVEAAKKALEEKPLAGAPLTMTALNDRTKTDSDEASDTLYYILAGVGGVVVGSCAGALTVYLVFRKRRKRMSSTSARAKHKSCFFA